MTTERAILVLIAILDRLEDTRPRVMTKETKSWQDWHNSRCNALKLAILMLREKHEQDRTRQRIFAQNLRQYEQAAEE